MAVSDWDADPNNNKTVGLINWSEGQRPNTVNNSARQMMAEIRALFDELSSGMLAGLAIGTDVQRYDAALSTLASSITNFGTSLASTADAAEATSLLGVDDALDGKADVPNRVIVSANHTAEEEQEVGVRTSLSAVTVFAPSSPATSAVFSVIDMDVQSEANDLDVDFGLDGFQGEPNYKMMINKNGLAMKFIFDGITWRFFG